MGSNIDIADRTISRLHSLLEATAEAQPDLHSAIIGADYPNRTDDLPLTRRLLYQLS